MPRHGRGQSMQASAVRALRDAGGEVVALVSHADGPAAARLDAMGPEERHRHAERELARLRPVTRDAVEAVASTSWANDPFAGEHTAVTQPGMEGAAESADRAVAEVLARIG